MAKDSNAIVPIISFKELSRSDWKDLPDIVANGFGNRANVVICTHLDQIHGRNIGEQLRTVTKTFWPTNPMATGEFRLVNAVIASSPYGRPSDQIIACSSLMGLSAQDLLDRSSRSKPAYGEITNERSVAYPVSRQDPPARPYLIPFLTVHNEDLGNGEPSRQL